MVAQGHGDDPQSRGAHRRGDAALPRRQRGQANPRSEDRLPPGKGRGVSMIKKLALRHFKGFERFEITFKHDNWLVGPNNAGKSTIIAALRTTAHFALA